MTKAEEVFGKVDQLVASGLTKAEAFKQLAGEYNQPVDSIRGSYYSAARKQNPSGRSRTRRRETTPEDAVADARNAFERAIEAIDREVEQARERAAESKAEFEDLKNSAAERKQAIQERLEALG